MMDPNTAARTMRDAEAPLEDRREACQALGRWLAQGGFPQRLYRPDGTVRAFGGNTAARFAATNEVLHFETLLGVER